MTTITERELEYALNGDGFWERFGWPLEGSGFPQLQLPRIHLVRSHGIGIYVPGGGGGPDPFVLGTTMPDASYTGRPVGRPALTVRSTNANGDYTLSSGETLIDAEIRGHLIVPVGCNGATARYNSVIGKANLSAAASGEGLVLVRGGSGNVIDQNDIGQTNATATWFVNGVKQTGGDATVSRNNIHDVLDGFYVTGGTISALGNFVHDFMFRSDDTNQGGGSPQFWSHNDGMQIRGGLNHLVDGNYFRGTFSDATGMPRTANPVDAAPYLWRNLHLMLVQSMASIQNLQINRNWFAYGSVGIQFAANGSVAGGTASMSGNRVAPNQAREFSQTRQFLIDSGANAITVTGVGTTTYMDHPDTPVGIIGQRIDASGVAEDVGNASTGQGGWAYLHNTLTPAPNGPSKPFV